MVRILTYSLGALLVVLAMTACNGGNNTSKQEDMDTNYSDTRRNTTDTAQTIPDTAYMKVDTLHQQAPASNQ